MARAGLGWSLAELAAAAGVDSSTIGSFERGIYAGEPKSLEKIRKALEKAGIEFINGAAPGVRLTAKRR
jgi:transcriptional regulator with XRE-family HTH domain